MPSKAIEITDVIQVDGGTLVYRYGGKLYQRTYNGPVTQTYATSGDGKRHSRTEGGNVATYYWDAGYTVVNESDGTNLTRTFVGRTLAHVDGTNPSTGTWAFFFHDNLGSARRLRNVSGTSLASELPPIFRQDRAQFKVCCDSGIGAACSSQFIWSGRWVQIGSGAWYVGGGLSGG